MTISLTTIIIGAVVVLLAILGSLINPFLRTLRFTDPDSDAADSSVSAREGTQPSITVLITAHDNLPELERNLPMFLHQKYAGEYQVSVVCQSTDGETLDYLKRMAAENSNLYYTYIPESSRYMSRKKLQITLGVKSAKYEWIILTEPTCKPENDKWLATMARNCKEPNHLVLGFVGFDEETKGVRRFECIRKAYYLLRRAQQTYGYRTHMPNVAFRKSDFMKEQGFQGNLEFVRGEYDFLVNKYAPCGETAVELDSDTWLTHDEPSDKSWHNAHLYLLASRKSLDRSMSMRTLMFFDHLMPHLSLIASLAVLAYSVFTKDWIQTGCAGVAILLLFILRMIIANKAIKHFDDEISMFVLPFYEYGIIWRNLANKIRYWHADKSDFTSHKL